MNPISNPILDMFGVDSVEDVVALDPKTGLWHRPGTDHLKTAREPWSDYFGLRLDPADRVLDVGAHIGGFMRLAHHRGVGAIWCVEPSPDTVEILRRNAADRDPSIRVIHAAATADPAPDTISLWLTVNHRSKSSCMASIRPTRGRIEVVVPAVSFRSLVAELKPTVVKVDIEGAEYLLDWTDLPDHIDRLALEIHGVIRPEGRADAEKIVRTLEDQGFASVGRRSLAECRGWDYKAVFER